MACCVNNIKWIERQKESSTVMIPNILNINYQVLSKILQKIAAVLPESKISKYRNTVVIQ